MNLFTVFTNKQDRRPVPKTYYRPANIETLHFSQSQLAKSIR